MLALIVVLCLLAPVYADHVAHTDPFQSNLNGTTIVDGKTVPVMVAVDRGSRARRHAHRADLGPGHYFLGADDQGRDVAARLLYGGRNSLLIGGAAALMLLSSRRSSGSSPASSAAWIDGVLSRILDVIWAFPVYLLAICLSIVLITERPRDRPDHASRSGSLWLPILIIGIVYVPVRRPARSAARCWRCASSEFVQAAIGLGAPQPAHHLLARSCPTS